MKFLILLFVILSSTFSMAQPEKTDAKCLDQAEKFALEAAKKAEDGLYSVNKDYSKFLGRVELPDLLDSDRSDFFELFYFVVGSDNVTAAVSVSISADCSYLTGVNVMGHN